MTTNTRPRIRLSQGEHGHTRIQIGRYRAFIPRGLLRTLADRIHDHADALDRHDREHGAPTATLRDHVGALGRAEPHLGDLASAGNASSAPPSTPATTTAEHPTPRDEGEAENGPQNAAQSITPETEDHP